ncbi:MAG: molybdopterin-guanine dinucleotide biosynthesis protein B [Streptococcaceae bacterium]|jgi:molybdopterin-guanine dinucleotide biosynthesis protein MobB|nr:molybdopterin-guanine dinucleotide biosynthesis protein B [Streptococcaceae bacterium]
MKILQIVGTKKSGKTTCVVDFITSAREIGLSVAAIKHSSHSVVMDTPETDSFKFAAAGAREVSLATADSFLYHKSAPVEIDEILSDFVSADTDLVLIEGFRSAEFPRLQLLKIGEIKDQIGNGTFGSIFEIGRGTDLTTTEKRKEWLKKWLEN